MTEQIAQREIVVQDGDDWMIIRLDGKIIYRGHSPTTRDWLEILSEEFGMKTDHQFGFFEEDSETFIED